MNDRLPITPAEARELHRPQGGHATLISSNGQTYEVVESRGGGRWVFRLELEVVPKDSDEFKAVVAAYERGGRR